MGVRQPFIGSYERIIGSNVYVKVYNNYIAGRVVSYAYKTGKYTVECFDGKTRRVETIYL